MKKKNLATAMAAAMAVSAVAPVVAHAEAVNDEKVTQKISEATELQKVAENVGLLEDGKSIDGKGDAIKIEKNTNIKNKLEEKAAKDHLKHINATIEALKDALYNSKEAIDLALSNGKTVNTMNYTEVYDTNGTLESKDDKLKLNKNQEILFQEGVIGKNVDADADKNPKFLVAKKLTEKELKDKAADIAKAKKANEDAEKDIKDTLEKTFVNSKGQSLKAYKSEKVVKEYKSAKATMQIVKLEKADVAENDAKDKYFVFKNMKLEQEKSSLPQINTVVTDTTYDVGTEQAIVKLNKDAYELNQVYNKDNTYTTSSDVINAGHINRTITVYDKATDIVLGTVVLNNYDKFKKENLNKFVDIAKIADIKSLDLPELSWAKVETIDALAKKQLKGYEDNTIKLNKEITRAEFAKLLVSLKNIDLKTKIDEDKQKDIKEFKDVSKDAWYHDYIVTLQNAKIVKGNGDGTFRPEDPITRQEVAVMLANAIAGGPVDKYDEKTGEQLKSKTGFEDNDSVAIWADASVRALKLAEVVNGYKSESASGKTIEVFKPEKDITRAEALVMITRGINQAKRINKAGLINNKTIAEVINGVKDGKEELVGLN